MWVQHFNKAAQPLLNRLGYEVTIRRMQRLKPHRRHIHFLHIGKCAGSEIYERARIINEQSKTVQIVKREHDRLLDHLPKDADYFFSIRDPVTRFKSSFYSRKNRGAPRYNVPWSPNEEIAFGYFDHANDLAEALFSDGMAGHHAMCAIKSIRHTARDQIMWFMMQTFFFERWQPVWIVRQEAFEQDFAELVRRMNLDITPEFPAKEAKAHKRDYDGIPALSAKATENLRAWYAQDVEFYRRCVDWMEAKAPTGNATIASPGERLVA